MLHPTMSLGDDNASVLVSVIIVVAVVACWGDHHCHSPLLVVILFADIRCSAQVLDDQTFAALQSVMLFNNVEILHKLQRDPAFFPDLFKKLRTTAPKVEPNVNLTLPSCALYTVQSCRF